MPPIHNKKVQFGDEAMPSSSLPTRTRSRAPSFNTPPLSGAMDNSGSNHGAGDASVMSAGSQGSKGRNVIPASIGNNGGGQSRWSNFFGGNNSTTTTTGEEEQAPPSDPTQFTKPSNNNNSNTNAPTSGGSVTKKTKRVNVYKQRQTKRQHRFRKGMQRAGDISVVEEGEIETEMTSRVTEDQLLTLDEYEKNGIVGVCGECCHSIGTLISDLCLACGSCFSCGHSGKDSGKCGRRLLWSALALVFGGLIAAICLYFFTDLLPFGPNSNSQELVATVAPTLPPSGPMNWTWDNSVLEGPPRPIQDLLPDFTLRAIAANATSPQAQAVAWVTAHPDHPFRLPNWKKVQLVALVSFFYAFNGLEWPEDKRIHWLDYDLDECQWGDAGKTGDKTGEYLGVACYNETTAATAAATSGSDPQDLVGRYQHLNLDWFLGFGMLGFPDPMYGDNNQMPPEVVFLDHLESLGLLNCGLQAQMNNLLPTTLSQMTKLEHLSFKFNALKGSLPSRLTQMTTLKSLSLGNNFLSGSLPSDIGTLDQLQEVFLYSNKFTGSLPSSFSKLTELQEFSAISNQLQGTLPDLSGMSHLEYFFIDHNPLMTGTVPAGVCPMANMTSFLVPCTIQCNQDCENHICKCY